MKGILTLARVSVAFFVLLVCPCACDAESRTTPEPLHQDDTDERELLSNVFETIERSGCRGNIDDESAVCEVHEIIFEPGLPSEDSLGQRIMILDQGMLNTSLIRYRPRVLAHVKEHDGEYQEFLPHLRFSRDGAHVHRLLADHDAFVPTSRIADRVQDLIKEIRFHVNPGEETTKIVGHGGPIFNFLADTNPQSQFVLVQSSLADFWLIDEGQTICDLVADEEDKTAAKLASIETRYQKLLESLETIVDEHKISFVSMSQGLDYPTIEEYFRAKCDGQVPHAQVIDRLLEKEHKFIRGLGQIPNGLNRGRETILVFQAGATSAGDDPLYPIDCDSSIDNRVRVGVFGYLGTDIAPDGTGDARFLEGFAGPEKCTDVFINVGFRGWAGQGLGEKREKALMLSLTGLDRQLSPYPPVTSYATPVALSHFIFLEQRLGRQLGFEEAMSALTGGKSRPMLDPIQHDLFELYRLGLQ